VSRAGQNQFGAQGSISIVDLASHDVTNVAVGAAAFGVDIDAANQRAAVADFGSNDVTIVRIPNPMPRVTDVQPRSVIAGSGVVTVTIFGSGFLPTSVATFNGQVLPTTYLSSTQLQAQVDTGALNQLITKKTQAATARAVAPRDVTNSNEID